MLYQYRNHKPLIDASCFVAQQASVIGDVTLKEDVSVWFGSVIRGDKDEIVIGKASNIQDNCTLHTDPNHRLIVGEKVTIGHNAILHGCVIEDEVLIGMGATILNGAHIGKHSIIGAGALVVENMEIPANSVVVGCPARVIKQTSETQIASILENAQHYVELGQEYKDIIGY